MAEMMQKALFSVQEAAEFLGVSESTIRRYISDGRLLAYRLGDERLIRIKRQHLDKLLSPINHGSDEESE
jgi:excisionase family DNA binding protein